MAKNSLPPGRVPAAGTIHRPYFPPADRRRPMVAWFNPVTLLKAARDLVLSSAVGSQVDTRELQIVQELEAATAKNRDRDIPIGTAVKRFEAGARGEFFFDFMGDTGDGWNSTYSVASLLTRDRLNVDDNGRRTALPRGDFLLIGSDVVYPTANETEYRIRFFRPFQHAWDWLWTRTGSGQREAGFFRALKKVPLLYAIPGNHDWFDSLSAFRLRFCNIQKPRMIGAWKSGQSRSYFALRLPADWYILALDIGLNQSMDNAQFNYFGAVIRAMPADARVIVVAAEPDWVQGGVQNPAVYNRLLAVEKMLADFWRPARGQNADRHPRVWINLTGDIHNYQAYARKTKETIKADIAGRLEKTRHSHMQRLTRAGGQLAETQAEATRIAAEIEAIQTERFDLLDRAYHPRLKIVAGGGGAFLHPTHGDSRRRMRVVPTPEFSAGRDTGNDTAEVLSEDLYESGERFPDEATSRRLARSSAWRFLPNNPVLATVVGFVYMIGGWFTMDGFARLLFKKGPPEEWLKIAGQFPLSAFLLTATFMALFAFAAHQKKSRAWIAGAAHGLLQSLLLLGGIVFWHGLLGPTLLEQMRPAHRSAVATLQFLLGFAPGTFLLGWSFWFNLTFFKTDHNNAFSHASIDRYKSFLRVKIEKNGRLTVYPIGFDRPVAYSVPEEDETDPDTWRNLTAANGEGWHRRPAYSKNETIAPAKIEYRLIGSPLVLPGRGER